MAVITKKQILVAAIGIFIAAALYPFESSVVPVWKIQVLDVEGKPCASMSLLQSWGHYSLFLTGGTDMEYALTDADGVVVFPERTVRASVIRRVVMPFVAEIMTLAHGSTGPSGTVHVTDLKDVAWLSYKVDQPLPNVARVGKCYIETREKVEHLNGR